jgi:hypothetical protein
MEDLQVDSFTECRKAELVIDAFDPAYFYTVAEGDGQTTTASEADVDVDCDPRPELLSYGC